MSVLTKFIPILPGGLAIFTSMRSGIAPFGGSGGAGIVVARLEDGSWSAPSAMSPNNLSAGLMLGIDIYDAVLVIRTPAALASFATHKATLGTDIGVAAGPFGAGAAAEMGLEKAPVLSYVRTRGLYAGIQLVGQIFVDRFDENAKVGLPFSLYTPAPLTFRATTCRCTTGPESRPAILQVHWLVLLTCMALLTV